MLESIMKARVMQSRIVVKRECQRQMLFSVLTIATFHSLVESHSEAFVDVLFSHFRFKTSDSCARMAPHSIKRHRFALIGVTLTAKLRRSTTAVTTSTFTESDRTLRAKNQSSSTKMNPSSISSMPKQVCIKFFDFSIDEMLNKMLKLLSRRCSSKQAVHRQPEQAKHGRTDKANDDISTSPIALHRPVHHENHDLPSDLRANFDSSYRPVHLSTDHAAQESIRRQLNLDLQAEKHFLQQSQKLGGKW